MTCSWCGFPKASAVSQAVLKRIQAAGVHERHLSPREGCLAQARMRESPPARRPDHAAGEAFALPVGAGRSLVFGR